MSKPSSPFTTLFDLIETRARSDAEKPALIFLDNHGLEIARLSYSELQQKGRAFASGLQQTLKPGDSVVLALPTGVELITIFFGALYAGVLPILLPAPRHKKERRNTERLRRVVEETRARFVFLTPEGYQALAASDLPPDCQLITDGEQFEASAAAWRRPEVSSSSPAYLQFTSGSTSRPKGVVLKHENVLANLELLRQVFANDRGRVIGWLPLHHDMGLVGHLLEPLYDGGTGVLAATDFFALNPLNWLKAISQYRGTSSGAPPFAYDVCARRASDAPPDLDLSCWKNAYVGSEPVSANVLESFAQAFAPYGFNPRSFFPCYGMAEATLFVAGRRATAGLKLKTHSEGKLKRQLLSYPLIREQMDARIVNPETCEDLPTGAVGEIWLSGPSVAEGYYGNTEATQETFVEATFNQEARTFLRTGDLGFLDDDELYITGRLKDLIIIRGANYYPEDLEATVRESHPRLEQLSNVCFSTTGRATEELIVVQEIKPSSKEDWPEIFEAIRNGLALEHGLQVSAIVLIRRGSLPRTTSGKVSRFTCRDAYLSGTLQQEAIWRNGTVKEDTIKVEATAQRETDFSTEPIAVIGMACRFPGEANDLESYWSLLADGVDAISETPPERWDVDLYYDPRPAIPGKMNTRWGGFIQGVENFDAEFFGIAPYEATEIDPQQRLLLEVAWRAFENAGLTLEQLSGSETGVFVGISTSDYLHLQISLKSGMEHYNAYSGLGNSYCISANRLSYLFNLRGPSVAVDTACSSSLTALHLAVQSLRNRECSAAIAGGVNVILSAGTTVTLSQFSMMAPDGRCKVFDSRADGYVRSEGSGLLVLKRQSDALRDGDRILAYIRGSALNQDGRSLGITAPNPEAQRRVIEKALKDARCRPEEITLIEAHGTGTAAGDPVEVEQLKRIYGGQREGAAETCYLGSVKANLGHLEACAGAASVIKLILALERGEIPPQINLSELNPQISLEGSRLVIPNERRSWKPASQRRLAAISSFGFGGANAHAILEAAEKRPDALAPSTEADAGSELMLFPLSGKSEAALREQAQEWVRFLREPEKESFASIVYSQAVRRSHFNRRAAFVAQSRAELAAQLEAFLQNRAKGNGPEYQAGSEIAFLFSGQGSQYDGMGGELYHEYPDFRQAFDLCAAVFEKETDARASLQSLAFSKDSQNLQNTLYLQPILFALEYAIARLLLSFNVKPRALLGHSLGEYAAACVAGCFEPEEGMRLVIERARLMASISRAGAMAAVAAGEAKVSAILKAEKFTGLSIAAINAPKTVVLSGPVEELDAAVELLARQGAASRRLQTSQAFHSSLMDEILDQFERVAETIEFREPRLPLISNLTGDKLREAPNAAYWRRHLRECVRFQEGIEYLHREGIQAYVEVGPGNTLLALARRSDLTPNLMLVPSCSGHEVRTFLKALGHLYVAGTELSWTKLSTKNGVRYVPSLPGHPFERKRYWFSLDQPNDSPPPVARADEKAVASFPLSNWGYHLRWIQSEPPQKGAPAAKPDDDLNWIIVGDGGGLARQLINKLNLHKRRIFRISYDSSVRQESRAFRRTTDRETGVQRFFVAPGCEADAYGQVLDDILNRMSRAGATRWNVAYLRSMDCASGEATTVESLERDQRLHAAGDLAVFTQALNATALAMRLWIVTTDAQPVHRSDQDTCLDPLNLAQTTTWGFGHTLFLEHPEMRGGMTDLATADEAAQQAEQVLAQIAANDGETLAAFREGVRYVPRLMPLSIKAPDSPLSFQRDGAYLITGGLGGLGLRCAQWMAERGAGHIILLGRTPLPPRETWDSLAPESVERRKVESIRAIEQTGASLQIRSIDVTDHERVSEVVREIKQSGLALRGVLHAAGLNWFCKIAELDRERMLETLKIKVSAAWNLYEATRDSELDFFLLFSSVSALWGSVDLAHYTAANLFLDALAYHCRREGRRALSIDWGPWSTIGMSARAREVKLFSKLGFRLMLPERAIRVMEALLVAEDTHSLVADLDWKQFQAFINFSACPLLFERVSVDQSSLRAASPATSCETDKIRAASPNEAHAHLVSEVRKHLSSVLLLEPGREVNLRQRFNLMGMDSLMAIAFALRLENLVGRKLPTTLAYNYPTIMDVADHLFTLIRDEQPPAASAETSAPLTVAEHEFSTNPRLWFPTAEREGVAGGGVRLFCFPYAGAGASIYRDWAQALSPVVEVLPVQFPGREEREGEPHLRELKELAKLLVDAMLELPPGPAAFFGHSLGALVAFEVARELRRRGVALPERLILSGCGAPGKEQQPRIHGSPDEEFKAHLVANFAAPSELTRDEAVWQVLLPTLRADVRLLETYEPDEEPPLELPVSVFGGLEDSLATREQLVRWSAYTAGDFSVRLFAGGHLFLRSEAAEVLEAIRKEFSQAVEYATTV
jgi:acyl transferase domain-containing protein/acyl-CoA synthetase (AMP-forming)/AMP-acid ligase II/surfactin synthase thioesterase subunit/acyl carrier protein